MTTSELISQTCIVEHDFTKDFPYETLVREELAHYSHIEITDDLTEGGMMTWFKPVKLYKYNAFMRLICTNGYLGARLDPDSPRDRKYLEKLIKIEVEQIKSAKLKPSEMLGVFQRIS